MWILPKQLISAFAPVMGESTSDCGELSQICGQSLMQRSKPSRASFFSREWKAGRLMRLQSGAISSPSRGQRFLDAWTSSLAVIPANPSAAQENDSEPTTSDTSGQPSQMEFGFCDQESASLRTSRDTSALGCEKSLQNWKDSVTARRGEYSARLKLARLTRESGCSSWPTATTRDWKGCGNAVPRKDGKHRLDTLEAVVMFGPAAPENPSTHGSRQESWPTPDATNANDGVPWERFHQRMMERRERVKQAVEEGKTKQGSGRSPNLAASVQNPQWATPNTRDWKDNGTTQPPSIGETRGFSLGQQMVTTATPGKLNPRWVETLMGLPIGWVMASCASPVTIELTSCASLETESSQPSQKEQQLF